jgi:FkbM family methyltransferase
VTLRGAVKAAMHRAGFDVRRADRASTELRRQRLLQRHRIGCVLDVGANAGQYAAELRGAGYTGRIVSFEPVPDAYAALTSRFEHDAQWHGLQVALGDSEGTAEFNVSLDGVCSSMLEPSEALRRSIPTAERARVEVVAVRTLDSVWKEAVPSAVPSLLKLDVQGFEDRVLDGAAESLARVSLLEVEMGLANAYERGARIYDLLPRLHEAGFDALWFEGGHLDAETCGYVDVDVMMVRRAAASA